MGISGHMLGEKKLRRLNNWSGMEFDRAFNRNGGGAARTIEDGACVHYVVDFEAKKISRNPDSGHWSSCYDGERVLREWAEPTA